jgi:hypothetical protein
MFLVMNIVTIPLMSIVDDDEFKQEILITLVFNVEITSIVLTCYFCHGIGHMIGSCPY